MSLLVWHHRGGADKLMMSHYMYLLTTSHNNVDRYNKIMWRRSFFFSLSSQYAEQPTDQWFSVCAGRCHTQYGCSLARTIHILWSSWGSERTLQAAAIGIILTIHWPNELCCISVLIAVSRCCGRLYCVLYLLQCQ